LDIFVKSFLALIFNAVLTSTRSTTSISLQCREILTIIKYHKNFNAEGLTYKLRFKEPRFLLQLGTAFFLEKVLEAFLPLPKSFQEILRVYTHLFGILFVVPY